MKKNLRKALVAVAALIAVTIVPISAATDSHAVGQGEWPQRVSSRS